MYKEHRTVLNKFQLLFSQRINRLARICLYLCLYIYMYPYLYTTLRSRPSGEGWKVYTSQWFLLFPASQQERKIAELIPAYSWTLDTDSSFHFGKDKPLGLVFKKQTIRIKTQSSSEYLSFLIRQCSHIYEVLTPRLFLRGVPPEDKWWACHGLTVFCK